MLPCHACPRALVFQTRTLGARLAELFQDRPLLPAEVVAVATGYTRAQQTAQSVLAGIFGTTSSANGVPVVRVFAVADQFVSNSWMWRKCPALLALLRPTPQLMEWKAALQPLAAEVERVFPGRSWLSVADLGMTHAAHGLPLPEDMPAFAVDAAVASHIRSWVTKHSQLKAARFVNGPLLHRITTSMDAAIARRPADPAVRCVLYSGHDTTIVPALCCLLAFETSGASIRELMPTWPPYASCLTVELLRKMEPQAGEEEFFVRATFNGQDVPVVLPDRCCPIMRTVMTKRQWDTFAAAFDHHGGPAERLALCTADGAPADAGVGLLG